jgi:hypothetical protein
MVKRHAGNFQFVPLLSSCFSLIVLKVPCGPIMCLGNVRGEGKSIRKGVRSVRRPSERAHTQEICVQGVFLCKCASSTHSHLYKNKLRLFSPGCYMSRSAVRDGIKMCPVSISYTWQRTPSVNLFSPPRQ